MLRKRWLWLAVPSLGLCVLGAVLYTTMAGRSQADAPLNANDRKGGDGPLPIKQVVLFNSGVGYFQREGDIDGSQRVELTFPVSDVNDLLKSLVLQDTRGQIGTVNYDSQDPIDKILRSFAIDLNSNPTFGQILNQARGEKIEVSLVEKKGERPFKLTGVIVGMETKKKVETAGMIESEILNLATEAGLQGVALEQVVSVRFLNPVLQSEFLRALQVLAHSHDTQKKTVSIGFQGEGKRPVRVGYVVERPIWKTSYRLRLEPNGKVFLQGWALVENTSDDDWNDVRMVLVSGRPISFKMNLYDPLYLPRPTVEPELFASLRPPVYTGAMGDADNGKPLAPMPFSGLGFIGGGAAAGAQPAPAEENSFNNQKPQGNFANGVPGSFRGGAFQGGNFGGGFNGGFGGGFNGSFQGQGGPNNYGNATNSANPMNAYQMQTLQKQQQELFLSNNDNNRLTYEQLMQRRQQGNNKREEAKKAGSNIAGMNFKEGIASVANAEEVGDYYRYLIDQKISLPRQKSAMLPILDRTIEGTKVSIYNEAVQAKFPLLGLKLKNTSGQPLTQGPITVYDDSNYAGDTRVMDLQPDEERLLSYALDQGTEVTVEDKCTPSPNMAFKIDTDHLTARFKLRETKTYTIKNRSTHDRLVILEHPIRSDWELLDKKSANEKARDVYRFEVKVPAGKTVAHDVVEEQARVDRVGLTAANPAPYYSVAGGIYVKQMVGTDPVKLVGLKIEKGVVMPTIMQRETRTYVVQNVSDIDRTFSVSHVIRPNWVRVADKEKQPGPDVFQVKLEVARGKTGKVEVAEQHTVQEKGKSFKELSETKLREYLAESAPDAAVKAAIEKALTQHGKIATARTQLHELENRLKVESDDQARLRENLKIIPETSAPYKKFLEKFVSQEAEIENLQRQVRQAQSTLQAETQAYETFVARLTVE